MWSADGTLLQMIVTNCIDALLQVHKFFLAAYFLFVFQTAVDGSLYPSRPHSNCAGRSDSHHSLLLAGSNFSVSPGEGATTLRVCSGCLRYLYL